MDTTKKFLYRITKAMTEDINKTRCLKKWLLCKTYIAFDNFADFKDKPEGN